MRYRTSLLLLLLSCSASPMSGAPAGASERTLPAHLGQPIPWVTSPDGLGTERYGLATSLNAEGLRLETSRGVVGLRLAVLDHRPLVRAPPRIGPSPFGTAAIATRTNMQEWWIATDRGVEWGWTVDRGSEALDLRIEVQGARAALGTAGVQLFVDDVAVLNLQHLRAWDANGGDLPARFVVNEGEMRVLVDATDASWPVSIDPLITTAWTELEAESTEVGLHALDANGDARPDLLIGGRLHLGGSGGLAGLDRVGVGVPLGVPVGDLDADGADELAVVTKTAVVIYAGEAGTPYKDVYDTIYGEFLLAAAAGDVDQDGVADVWLATKREAILYRGGVSGLAGPVHTIVPTAHCQPADASITEILDPLDVDGDGQIDLVIRGRWCLFYDLVIHDDVERYRERLAERLALSYVFYSNFEEGEYKFTDQKLGYSNLVSTKTSGRYSSSRETHSDSRGVRQVVPSAEHGSLVFSGYGTTDFTSRDDVSKVSQSFRREASHPAGSWDMEPPNTQNMKHLTAGDFDGDGSPEVLYYDERSVRLHAGPLRLWNPTYDLALATPIHNTVVVDLDSDGFDELVTLIDGPAVRIYRGSDLYIDADKDGLPFHRDCDDDDPLVGEGGPEVPLDGVDNDCDGFEICFVDRDGDGYHSGELAPSTDLDCLTPPFTPASTPDGDCDDDDATRHPGAYEPVGVNGRQEGDKNCDALIYCYVDDDHDDARTDEVRVSDSYLCMRRDSLARHDQPLDCDDDDPTVGAAEPESPGDGVDDDCDGFELCFRDLDGDGFRAETTAPLADLTCSAGGYLPVGAPIDCDDGDPLRTVDCGELAAARGCSCSTTPSPTAWAAFLSLLLMGWRRRRTFARAIRHRL